MAVGDAHAGLRGPVELNKGIGDLKEIKVKSGRLRDLTTRTLVPSVGLHVSLLSSISLFERSEWQFLAMLPLFLLALCMVILHRILNGAGEDVVVASRQATAIFGFLVLSAIAATATARGSLSDNSNTLLIGLFLAACFGVIALLCLKRHLDPLGMVVMASYCVAFFRFFGKVDNFIAILTLALPCLLIAALVVLRLREERYMVGVAFAGLVTIVLGGFSQSGEGAAIVLATGLLLLVPLFMYERNARQPGYSDLLRFLVLGVAAAIVCVSIAAFEPREAGLVFFFAAILFGIFTAVLWRPASIEARPILLAWLAILFSMSAVSLDVYEIAYVLCSISLFAVSLRYGNEFVRVLAGASGGVGLWLVIHRLKEAVDRLFATGGDNTSGLATTLDPSLGFLFGVAVALVGVSLVISHYRIPPHGRPWWNGLVKRRHAATLRQIFRTVQGKLKDVPIVGWIYGTTEATLKSLRFVKGDGTAVGKYDVLQMAAFVGAALATTYFLTPIVFDHIETIEGRISWAKFVAVLIAWLICGAALALWGNAAQSLFHTMLAFVFFSAPVLSSLVGQTLFSPKPANQSYLSIMLVFWACPVFLVSLLPKPKRKA